MILDTEKLTDLVAYVREMATEGPADKHNAVHGTYNIMVRDILRMVGIAPSSIHRDWND